MLIEAQLSGRGLVGPGEVTNRISGQSMGIDSAIIDQIILFRQ